MYSSKIIPILILGVIGFMLEWTSVDSGKALFLLWLSAAVLVLLLDNRSVGESDEKTTSGEDDESTHRFVSSILNQGLMDSATQITFTPVGVDSIIRSEAHFVIDGESVHAMNIPRWLHEPVISQLKKMSGISLDETEQPHCGVIDWAKYGKNYRLRVVILALKLQHEGIQSEVAAESAVITVEPPQTPAA